jgi:hypothetical protein
MVTSSKSNGHKAQLGSSTSASRLRNACDGALLTSQPPLTPDLTLVTEQPRILRKCNGADIIKKNAARRKKYLIAFPGGIALTPGARVGLLQGLDSSTPTLDIEYPDGRLRMHGVLVFPRNPLLTLKCPSGKAKPVQCADTFETVIAFSGWAWIGDVVSNPGNLPVPLPSSMRGVLSRPLWNAASTSGGPKAPSRSSSGSIHLDRMMPRVDADDDVSAASSPELTNDEVLVNDDDDSVLWNPAQSSAKINDSGVAGPAPIRSNPTRGRRPDFKGMFADSSEDEEEDDDENEEDGAEDVDEDAIDASNDDPLVVAEVKMDERRPLVQRRNQDRKMATGVSKVVDSACMSGPVHSESRWSAAASRKKMMQRRVSNRCESVRAVQADDTKNESEAELPSPLELHEDTSLLDDVDDDVDFVL